MLKNKHWFISLSLLFSIIFLVFLVDCRRAGETSLTLLAWVGYEESEFLEPLEKELGVEINVRTYVGGDQMYSLFQGAPKGSYDLIVVDAEYGERMYKEGLLIKIDKGLWYNSDLFYPFSEGVPVKSNEDVYAVVVRWGSLGIVFNQNYITPQEAHSYSILWAPELKGRVGIFDWYLPNMGVISRYLGNSEPYNLDKGGLEQLKNSLLSLRPQVKSIHPDTGNVINDLRTEEVLIVPGIGEWAAAVLAEEDRPIDWSVPNEGGVMWVEAFAIPTSSRNKELAGKLIELVKNPQHLARLSWRDAYHSQVTRKSAYNQMTEQQKKLLKAEEIEKVQSLINRLSIRKLPGPHTTERAWMRVWTEFKVGMSQR